MDRAARVRAMEAALDESADALERMSQALDAYERAAVSFAALSAYYGSAQWSGDREADERGELPQDLRRGVLSEDLAYDLIVGQRETAIRMIEAATRTLKDA